MDKKEEEFNLKLLATFKIEAEEHIKNLSQGLIMLEGKLPPEKEKEVLETIFREAHSLKGAARSVSQGQIQQICQSLENVLDGLKKRKLEFSENIFTTLYEAIDCVSQVLQGKADETLILLLSERLDFLSLQKKEEAIPKVVVQETPVVKALKDSSLEAPSSKTIRISIQKLDELMQQVEEMLMLKLASKKQVNDLQNLLFELEEWDKKWGQVQKEVYALRASKQGDFDSLIHKKEYASKLLDYFEWHEHFMNSLEEKMRLLTKTAMQDHRLASSVVDMLLEDTKKVLMQPLSVLYEVFPRMCRDISHALGKDVRLEMIGGDIEVDRRILEEIKDPMIHLLRNCIDHGIESKEERLKYNKEPSGLIQIIASQVSGNRMEMLIIDDGKGIDIEKVKAKGVEQKLFSRSEAENLTKDEVLSLILHSGISTSNMITELSGRGLGLGIVSEKVDRLGGQVVVESEKGKGTTFKILLPLTQATFRGIQVKVNEHNFIVPTHNVRRVLRLKKDEIRSTEGRLTINVDDKAIAFVNLASVLKIPVQDEEKKEYTYAVVLKSSEKMIAFAVDEIINEQEVLVKTLGKEVQHVNNILAATVTEWGQVIPILNPPDLIKSATLDDHVSKFLEVEDKAEEKKKTILVAEDSITSRMLLKNILEAAGFEVKATVDGVEAFGAFTEGPYDLLLFDVEMPRMDGFTLTKKIRSTEKGKHLPIVLCTSRGSKEDREQGIEAGANAYIDKNSFTQDNLLNIIKRLL